MELRTVDPRTLVVNPDNPRRSAANPVADEQMAAAIKVVGIIQPPVVKETPAGLEIVVGERRVKGAIANDLATITVLVAEGSISDQAMAAIIENVVRAPLSPVDQWRAIDRLEAAGWNVEAISATLALPTRTIRKLKLLASIHPPMLEHIAQGVMPNESTCGRSPTRPSTSRPRSGKDASRRKASRSSGTRSAGRCTSSACPPRTPSSTTSSPKPSESSGWRTCSRRPTRTAATPPRSRNSSPPSRSG